MSRICFTAALSLSLALSAARPFRTDHLVFDPDKDSHGHVHASCVVECPSGDLLVVWYENGPDNPAYEYRKDGDKRDDVRIGGARLGRGRTAWEKPFVMSDTFGVSDNNPALVIDRRKRLWLIHPTLIGVPQRAWGSSLLWYKISSDYQKPGRPRWDRESILIPRPKGFEEVVRGFVAQARERAGQPPQIERWMKTILERLDDPLARRLGWMTRAHPLVLDDGAVLVPFANENFNVAAFALTRDGGETWTFSHVVPGRGVTQPSVVKLSGGRLAAFFRDAGGRDHRIKRSESTDGGLTWSPVTATGLPNPGSGVEAVMLKNGHLAMIYNDLEKSPRYRLAVSISTDEGATWKWTRRLEDQAGGRFDYPSLIQAKDGTLHATYSWNTRAIKHAHFNEQWVQQGE